MQLQPWQSDDGADTRLAERIVEALGHPSSVEVIARPRTIHDAVRRFASAHAVVGLRHHSLIAAAEAGTPFLAIAHEPKLAAIARRLQQPAVPIHASPAVLARSTVELLDRSAADRALIDGEKASARQAMRLLRVVVSGGANDDLIDRDRLALSPSGRPW